MSEIKDYKYLDGDFYNSIKEVLEQARKRVYRNIQSEMVLSYWQIGRMIVKKQGGNPKANYGDGLIKELSAKLTKDFGKGFNERNLEQMRRFYQLFQKPNAVRAELSWTHYRLLLHVENEQAKKGYIAISKVKWFLLIGKSEK